MKTYVKPELYYEHYELSQHIADCAIELQYGDAHSCIAYADSKFIPGLEGTAIFTADNGSCASGDMFCYTAGSDGFNTFRS